jgi:hypothetical protein
VTSFGVALTSAANIANCARSTATCDTMSSTSSRNKMVDRMIRNLAPACHRCNLHKGPNLTGIDPETGASPGFFILGVIDGATTSPSKASALAVSQPSVAQLCTSWI